jgi:TolB-like protein/DNA-binding SARP family transcriptional activator
MTHQVQVNFFGGVDIRSADRVVAKVGKKSQALLSILAVEKGAQASRERLATLLWGDMGDERARHNLRQALSQLRGALGPIIATDGDNLQLDASRCITDVTPFHRLKRAQGIAELKEGLEVFRGDFAEGLQVRAPDFEEWLRETREQMRGTACVAIDRLADLLISGGYNTEAEAVLRRRLSIDPCCEKAHRSLMELLTRQGRRTDALRQFQLCTDALKRELDTRPGSETQAVYDAMLQVDETTALPPALQAQQSSGGGNPILAVLPFENLSGDDDLYFSDGITEDLTVALSRFRELEVIARPSSFRYRGLETPTHEVAAALGASFLVRGSVRRGGNKVRINVQLLHGQRGATIWAQQYDKYFEDVFAVQTEIVSTLVSTLVGRVESARHTQSRGLPLERLEAYDILLRGKYHHHLFTAEDCRTCIELFELAIARDPDYALAHAWLACGLGQAMVHDLDDRAKLVDQSQAAAERGLELDEDESECHRVLAQIHLTRGDVRRSLWHQERALFLNPNDDRSLCAMGEILTFAGEPVAGEEWIRKALRLNPYHPERYWSHLARTLFHQERFEETLSALDRISRQRPDDLVYALAVSAITGAGAALERAQVAVRAVQPPLDPIAFARTIPFERAKDLSLLLGALGTAD